MEHRRWSDLRPRTRRLLVAGAVLEGILKLVALNDLWHRAPGQIRGRKWVWATVLAVANSVGVVPLAYFLFGRRRISQATGTAGHRLDLRRRSGTAPGGQGGHRRLRTTRPPDRR